MMSAAGDQMGCGFSAADPQENGRICQQFPDRRDPGRSFDATAGAGAGAGHDQRGHSVSEHSPGSPEPASCPPDAPTALTSAFAAHAQRLKQTVRFRLDRRLQGRLDESDVIQEAFVSAVREYQSWSENPDVTMYVWLHRLTVRRIIDLHREHLGAGKRSVEREAISMNACAPGGSEWAMSEFLAASLTSPSNAVLREERQQQVLAGLIKMNATDREVLVMRHFESMSNDETAMALGITATAASNRYVRALSRLNRLLASVQKSSSGSI